MFVLMAMVTVRPGAGPAYEALLLDTVQELSKQDCFVQFHISRAAPANTYLLHEVWTSRLEYEEVRLGEAFARYLRERERLVESVNRSNWEQLAVFGRVSGPS